MNRHRSQTKRFFLLVCIIASCKAFLALYLSLLLLHISNSAFVAFLAYSFFMIPSLLSILYGKLLDRFSVHKTLSISFICSSFITLFFIIAPIAAPLNNSAWQTTLLINIFILGGLLMLLEIGLAKSIKLHFPAGVVDEISKKTVLISFISLIIGPILYGISSIFIPIEYNFLVAMGLLILGFFVLMPFTLPMTKKNKAKKTQTTKHRVIRMIWRKPLLRLYYSLMIPSQIFINGTLSTFLAVYFKEYCNISSDLLLSILYCVPMLGLIMGAILTINFKLHFFYKNGMIGVFITNIILASAAFYYPLPIFLLIIFIMPLLVGSLITECFAYIQENFKSHQLGVINGFNALTIIGAPAIGSLLLTLISHYGDALICAQVMFALLTPAALALLFYQIYITFKKRINKTY